MPSNEHAMSSHHARRGTVGRLASLVALSLSSAGCAKVPDPIVYKASVSGPNAANGKYAVVELVGATLKLDGKAVTVLSDASSKVALSEHGRERRGQVDQVERVPVGGAPRRHAGEADGRDRPRAVTDEVLVGTIKVPPAVKRFDFWAGNCPNDVPVTVGGKPLGVLPSGAGPALLTLERGSATSPRRRAMATPPRRRRHASPPIRLWRWKSSPSTSSKGRRPPSTWRAGRTQRSQPTSSAPPAVDGRRRDFLAPSLPEGERRLHAPVRAGHDEEVRVAGSRRIAAVHRVACVDRELAGDERPDRSRRQGGVTRVRAGGAVRGRPERVAGADDGRSGPLARAFAEAADRRQGERRRRRAADRAEADLKAAVGDRCAEGRLNRGCVEVVEEGGLFPLARRRDDERVRRAWEIPADEGAVGGRDPACFAVYADAALAVGRFEGKVGGRKRAPFARGRWRAGAKNADVADGRVARGAEDAVHRGCGEGEAGRRAKTNGPPVGAPPGGRRDRDRDGEREGDNGRANSQHFKSLSRSVGEGACGELAPEPGADSVAEGDVGAPGRDVARGVPPEAEGVDTDHRATSIEAWPAGVAGGRRGLPAGAKPAEVKEGRGVGAGGDERGVGELPHCEEVAVVAIHAALAAGAGDGDRRPVRHAPRGNPRVGRERDLPNAHEGDIPGAGGEELTHASGGGPRAPAPLELAGRERRRNDLEGLAHRRLVGVAPVRVRDPGDEVVRREAEPVAAGHPVTERAVGGDDAVGGGEEGIDGDPGRRAVGAPGASTGIVDEGDDRREQVPGVGEAAGELIAGAGGGVVDLGAAAHKRRRERQKEGTRDGEAGSTSRNEGVHAPVAAGRGVAADDAGAARLRFAVVVDADRAGAGLRPEAVAAGGAAGARDRRACLRARGRRPGHEAAAGDARAVFRAGRPFSEGRPNAGGSAACAAGLPDGRPRRRIFAALAGRFGVVRHPLGASERLHRRGGGGEREFVAGGLHPRDEELHHLHGLPLQVVHQDEAALRVANHRLVAGEAGGDRGVRRPAGVVGFVVHAADLHVVAGAPVDRPEVVDLEAAVERCRRRRVPAPARRPKEEGAARLEGGDVAMDAHDLVDLRVGGERRVAGAVARRGRGARVAVIFRVVREEVAGIDDRAQPPLVGAVAPVVAVDEEGRGDPLVAEPGG
ncbi:hypothetical protein OUZ56_032509 [Daphnia magna]|uniref:Uncharacterized protein n=1 Tax=Daphnia magna TaxID=35525 RepID=A0ABR0B944_9CRUS|nr:hypothetical protein OUZ56_032509 [Daphnia magna]